MNLTLSTMANSSRPVVEVSSEVLFIVGIFLTFVGMSLIVLNLIPLSYCNLFDFM